MDNKNPQTKSVDLEIDERTAKGRYANLVVISHSPSEFIVDFAANLPGLQKPTVHSRVILTPEHAKRLLYSLQENITRYEAKNGAIEIEGRNLSPQEIITSILGEA